MNANEEKIKILRRNFRRGHPILIKYIFRIEKQQEVNYVIEGCRVKCGGMIIVKGFFTPFTSFEELTVLRNEKITDLIFKKLLPRILGENAETENEE